MNKWIGSGKITEEPTIRYNGDKASFVAFTMMCKRNRKIKEGDQPVDFIDCVCVGQNAKLAQEFLRKGKKVEVCGPLVTPRAGVWIEIDIEKDGRKVYTKTVFVEDLSFAESKLEEEARLLAEKDERPPKYGSDFMDIPDNDDGLPFQ